MTSPPSKPPLPAAPRVELDVVRETSSDRSGFLHVRRFQLVARHEDGFTSEPFAYDVLDRRALDASVMVAHYVSEQRTFVYLRSAIRPPIALRPIPPKTSGVMWEVPAGLVEPGESPATAAARELGEELGFTVPEASMLPLGSPSAPAPGFIGELHHYFHVAVDPTTRGEPSGDGSALEHGARIVAIALDDALAAARRGDLADAKTELALRRLADLVGERSSPLRTEDGSAS